MFFADFKMILLITMGFNVEWISLLCNDNTYRIFLTWTEQNAHKAKSIQSAGSMVPHFDLLCIEMNYVKWHHYVIFCQFLSCSVVLDKNFKRNPFQ